MSPELAAILTPKVEGRYGAPMGRPNRASYTDRRTGDEIEITVNEHAQPFALVRVPIDSQGYDQGRAYWGHGNGVRLYGYVGPLTDIRGFVWAADRDAAKAEVRVIHPLARFHR